MANRIKSVPENVVGDYFVDTTCIDCDTCRQIAPATFGETRDTAYVHWQPQSTADRRAALLALVSCPTGSIGCGGTDRPQDVMDDFPLLIDEPVYYCGFNSPKSYGGNSYFIRHAEGNWLIDSPKFQPRLVKQIEEVGGIAKIFLTHSDDVADAAKYAKHFQSERIIHWLEHQSQPDAELFLKGPDPIELADDFIAIPTPGHTDGHTVLLYDNKFLFTGDHLYWDRHAKRLSASHDYCWYSWPEQTVSMRRLAEYSFEWVLPGHGQRAKLSRKQVAEQMQDLVGRMRTMK
jgi:glyoxylase-like metal-dependent hydrolase (beta-lactamase superfamily II)/ferredoxin